MPEEVHSNINFIGYGNYSENIKYKLALLLRKPSNDTVRYMFGKLKEPKCAYKVDIDGSTMGEIKILKLIGIDMFTMNDFQSQHFILKKISVQRNYC